MKKIRIGTFLCWAFGHKFIFVDKSYVDGRPVYTTTCINFCSRCGINREGL